LYYCVSNVELISFLLTGKNPTSEYLDGMMNEAPGPINFTMFLTLFGERLQGTDPEDVIKNAFGCFDEENSGIMNEERLRELLTTMGDRFTDEEVNHDSPAILTCHHTLHVSKIAAIFLFNLLYF
jgi:Ca2+-binding EF-hand superfamily protein